MTTRAPAISRPPSKYIERLIRSRSHPRALLLQALTESNVHAQLAGQCVKPSQMQQHDGLGVNVAQSAMCCTVSEPAALRKAPQHSSYA
jgi:hypothetical protein